MKRIQIQAITPKVLREALKSSDGDIVIVDGEEPLLRLVSVAAEIRRRGDFFVQYPHDPAECFGTCWRHNGAAEADAPADAKEPALAG